MCVIRGGGYMCACWAFVCLCVSGCVYNVLHCLSVYIIFAEQPTRRQRKKPSRRSVY
jgi:hypothetical protein